MLQSIALMMLLGMALGWLCKKVSLPGLVGMIATGMILGPYGLGWLDSSILDISSQLRRIALIIILMRAGLSLNLEDLKKAGRPAILMCFVPACFEVAGMIVLAPMLLGVSRLDADAKRGNAEPLTAPAKKFRIACGRAVGNIMTYYRGYACRVCVEADARKPGARLLGTERIKFRFAHCCGGAACKLKKVVARSFYPD